MLKNKNYLIYYSHLISMHDTCIWLELTSCQLSSDRNLGFLILLHLLEHILSYFDLK